MIEIRKDEYDRNIVLVPLSDYVAIKRYRIDEAPCYKDYDYKYFLFIERFDDVERTVLSGELVDYISTLEAEVERLKIKNVELHERLKKVLELPVPLGTPVLKVWRNRVPTDDTRMDFVDMWEITTVSFKLEYYTLWGKRYFHNTEEGRKAAEARLAELKGGKER